MRGFGALGGTAESERMPHQHSDASREAQDTTSADPLFSLIIPVYNVAPFLPDFLTSLSAQANDDFEVIFVNDGSTDDSGSLIETWIQNAGARARLVEQPNQGISAARNTGLEHAGGTWISFPDPDDVLGEDYLSRVRSFLDGEGRDADLVCTHVLMLNDATGTLSDNHPLHRKFSRGTQLVDLSYSPEYIHLQSASAFYRRDRLERLGLRFDESIKPNFEDAYLTILYLNESDHPRLGVVADASYLYRQRSDGSSLVQKSWTQESKYSTLLEQGYLRVLEQVRLRRGYVPVWAQNTVLYDLLFFFRHEQSTHGPTGLARREWWPRFHELVERILDLIDVSTIDAFSVMPTSRQLKQALIAGYHRQRSLPTSVRLARIDAQQRIALVRYFYSGDRPSETFCASGHVVRPTYDKVRDLTYFGRVLVRERIVWLPATEEIRVFLDDHQMPIDLGQEADPIYAALPDPTWRRLTRHRRAPKALKTEPTSGVPARASRRPRRRRRTPLTTRLHRLRKRIGLPTTGLRRLRNALTRHPEPSIATRPGPFGALNPSGDAELRARAKSAPVRARYRRAWTFLDRDTEAHDNAEHLYRWVLRHRPETNAWFVLRRESTDWDRLAAEGFRLVEFGTAEHVLLLLNTEHLISSQVDHYVVRPLDEARFGSKYWRFTFLQHGVTKDDLSRWVNGKPISRFITASPAEHASIAGDHTPYLFSEKETRLTGFPRHDRLLDLGHQVARPDLILIMPTWRRCLMEAAHGGNSRRLLVPLASSRFGRSWFDLVGSDSLRLIAEANQFEIAFMPHPNMQAYFSAADVPEWVQVRTYDRDDVQELLARTAVAVTDYSSQAFEAAYLERPVVYFQFDRDEFFSGTHVYRQGSWSYEQDGFGPVTTTQSEALDAIAAAASGPAQDAYGERMRTAFAYRDGRCCERTFDSIFALTRPAPLVEQAPAVLAGDRSAEAVVADHSVDEAAMAWLTGSRAGDHDLTETAAPRRSVA